MTKVIGVRFRQAGKVYFFSPGKLHIKKGDKVIVETARGVEFGSVVAGPKEIPDEEIMQPLKSVIRIATEEDKRNEEKNREKEKEAYNICLEKIRAHNLDMKLINAEYTFDNNKVLFYFTADGRIDFRELVKDLAAVFRTRIELRQIGVRDETKLKGGIGICGRPLCCHTYLSEFAPVSIKMAKEQNLSLNQTKISGVCGRLMCCLQNEQETYEYLNSRLPSVGDIVYTKDGEKGEVQTINVLRQLVKLVVDNGDEKELREYKVDDLNFRPKKRKDVKITEEELKELEGLEDDAIVEEVQEHQEKPRKFNKERKFDRERSFNKDRSNKEDFHKKEDFYKKEEFHKKEVNTDVVENVKTEEHVENENGENRHYKKRYDGKGKRYFGKNKKRYNNSPEKE